ncbi:hypothetical protein ACROYT_G031383 [Oculina patagonica]
MESKGWSCDHSYLQFRSVQKQRTVKRSLSYEFPLGVKNRQGLEACRFCVLITRVAPYGKGDHLLKEEEDKNAFQKKEIISESCSGCKARSSAYRRTHHPDFRFVQAEKHDHLLAEGRKSTLGVAQVF